MRTVIQRVSQASVSVEGRCVGRIAHGLLVLVAFTAEDSERECQWMAEKILKLRLFDDSEGRMNRDVLEAGGSILVVSQFTLYGDAHKGSRPSYIRSAPAAVAEPLYQRFVEILTSRQLCPVEQGQFGAMMSVELTNSGPVTLLVDSPQPKG